MGVLIDASVLIECERSRADPSTWIEGREDEEFFLSVITASELLHGVHRASDSSMRTRRAAFVEAVLVSVPLLPIDLASARAHARLWVELAGKGRPVGPHDLWLAAACLAHGLMIVTHDVREFERVPGLMVEAWRA